MDGMPSVVLDDRRPHVLKKIYNDRVEPAPREGMVHCFKNMTYRTIS